MESGGNSGKEGAGFVRADQIDLKSIDEQLQRHLNKSMEMEKQKKFNNYKADNESVKDREILVRHGWEIDPSKLIIKSMIARGTFGIVHRGVYDGLDVAVKLLDWGEDQKTEGENASVRAAFAQEFIRPTMDATALNIQSENGHIGIPRNGGEIFYMMCEAIDGEVDPQCLLIAFHVVELATKLFPGPSCPLESNAEEIFELLGRFFPVYFTHPNGEEDVVSREALSEALRMIRELRCIFIPRRVRQNILMVCRHWWQEYLWREISR